MSSNPPASGATGTQPVIALRPWTPSVRGLLAVVVLVSAVSLRLTSNQQSAPASPLLPVLQVDPSTAPPHVLEALPQIGPSLANRIVAARQSGPFASLADLRRRVRGLGPATLAKLTRYLRFDDQPGPTIATDGSLAAASPDEPSQALTRRPPVR